MTNYVEQLKRYKAPWWARLLGQFNKWWRDTSYHHVATVRLYERSKQFENNRIRCHFLHLYVRADGKKRKCDWVVDGVGSHYSRFSDYQKYVRPWLDFETDDQGVIITIEMISKEYQTAKGTSHGSWDRN